MVTIFVISQLVGVLAIAINLSSQWVTTRNSSIWLNCLSSVFFVTSFGLIGLWGTASLQVVNLIRGALFAAEIRWLWISSAWMAASFVALNWAVYFLVVGTPTNWVQWLPIIGTTISATGTFLPYVLHLKVAMLASMIVWCVYGAQVGVWGVLAGDLFGLVLLCVAVTRIVLRQRTADRSSSISPHTTSA